MTIKAGPTLIHTQEFVLLGTKPKTPVNPAILVSIVQPSRPQIINQVMKLTSVKLAIESSSFKGITTQIT